MNLIPSLLLAFQIFDFIPRPVTAEKLPETHFSEKGQGVLDIVARPAGMAGSVPRGATNIPMLRLDISPDCENDITLEGITLTHTGLGSVSDIEGVFLSTGQRRVTRVLGFDSGDKKARLRFSPPMKIPKCSAISMQAMINLSPDAKVASEHSVNLKSASDIQSTAKSIKISDRDPSERIIANPKQAGTITVNFLPLYGRLRYGRIETAARIKLSADNKSAHLLKKITLINQEDARDMNLTDMTLQTRSGTVLTRTAQRMHGKTVTLEFNPSYILRRNETLILLLKARVNGGPQRKVNFYLEEKNDLETR